ncbi:tetratricopeptide repeat protein [Sinobacterium caligoides]|uniref:Tetratricopeptide repeat protein n=1 Tax=Sinobacterium caligoides TaxID=933926 RepID=A0A3N2DXT2_9GAMM|nr:hypothetical protein [Sinobacterium caligoides]ROS04641.1 tetratricopeptide repeat protein [Sinobacterium caligoides]
MPDPIEEEHSLPEQLHCAILRQCHQGYQLYDQGNYKQALLVFYKAWISIPKPQAKWQESTWVLTALGDAYLKKGDYAAACEALRTALRCHLALDNPVIHLKLAQSYVGARKHDLAKEHFMKAISGGGCEIVSALPAKYNSYIEPLIQQLETENNG